MGWIQVELAKTRLSPLYFFALWEKPLKSFIWLGGASKYSVLAAVTTVTEGEGRRHL